jgi:surfactin synthase thioesterase subunit
VQLPGRENRIREDPHFELADLVAAITARADRPYAIYGHSLGGRHAFEIVRSLRRTGGPLPVRLYVGGCRAPHIRASGPFDGLSTLEDAELIERVAEGGGLSPAVIAEPELIELLLPVLRADFRRLDDYVFVAGEPVPLPIVAFAGRADRAVPLADIQAWDRHAGGGLTVHEVDGDHFFLNQNGNAVTGLLAEDLLAAVGHRSGGEVAAHER